MNENGVNFDNILQFAISKQQRKLKRRLVNFMFDEYLLDEKTKLAIRNKKFHFPDIIKVKTDKCILTRSQNTFSARVHYSKAATYFHNHDFIEMLYVYRGRCRQYIDSFDQTLEMFQGDIFLLNPNVTHAIQQSSEEDIIIQMIIPHSYIDYQFIDHLRYNKMLYDFFFNIKAKRNDYYHYIVFRNSGFEKTKYYVENIMTDYCTRSMFYEEAVQCYLRLLLIELSRNYVGVEYVKYKMPKSSIEIGEITRYIYDHSSDITLEELSSVFSFNMSYLSRVIRETSHNTFQELLKQFRIEKVEFLLQNSDLTVEQIAHEVGYKNANAIFKGIREKHGVTPIQYRKVHNLE